MLSLLMVLMRKSIAKVTFEMLYFFVVWVCKISLKSMLQSYVSKFKLFIFHFRCNSLYNLNMFRYQIVLCFRVHFIMGSLTIFQMFYLSILSCLTMLCYHARFQWVTFRFVSCGSIYYLKGIFVLVCIVYICFNILFSSHNLGGFKVVCGH